MLSGDLTYLADVIERELAATEGDAVAMARADFATIIRVVRDAADTASAYEKTILHAAELKKVAEPTAYDQAAARQGRRRALNLKVIDGGAPC